MAVRATVSPRRSRRRPVPPGAPAAAQGKSPPAARLTGPRRLGLAVAPVSRLVIDRVGRSPSAYSWPARHRGLRRRFPCRRMSRASEVAAVRHRPPARASPRPRPAANGRFDRRDPVSRVTRSHQDRSVGVPSGVGDEYAISERPTPPRNSRLTGDRTTPTDAAIVRSWPTGRSCHAANGRAERNSRSRPAGDRPSARAHRSR